MRYAFAAPIRKGQTEACRRFYEELKGPRRDEYADMQRRTGVTEEAYWLRTSPKGDTFIMTSNSDQREFVELMQNPQTDFERWFRDQVNSIFEVDLDPNTPPPELLMDWHA